MKYSLEDLPNTPTSVIENLSKIGIDNTDILLVHASTPKQRKELSGSIKVSEDAITELASMSDLLRVKGIGPAYADMLVRRGGMRNIQDLLTGVEDKSNTADYNKSDLYNRESVLASVRCLQQRLRGMGSEFGPSTNAPSINRLIGIVEEAKELRPRLVFLQPSKSKAFRKLFSELGKKDRRSNHQFYLAFLAIVFLAIAIIVITHEISWVAYIKNHVYLAGDRLEELAGKLLIIKVEEMRWILILDGAAILIGILFAWAIHSLVAYFLRDTFGFWLFNSPGYRKYYLMMRSNIDTTLLSKQTNRILVGTFLVFVSVLVFLFLLGGGVYGIKNIDFNYLSKAIVFGVIFLIVSGSLPYVVTLLMTYPKIEQKSSPGFKHYIFFQLAQGLTLPLMLFILIQFILPLETTLFNQVSSTLLFERNRNEAEVIRREILSLEFQTDEDINRKHELLDIIDGSNSTETLITNVNLNDIGAGVLTIKSVLYWALVLSFLIFIVLPFLVLGGWAKGIYYMLIILGSFLLENYIVSILPEWFVLKTEKILRYLIVGIFVFSSAVMIDWVIDRGTEDAGCCPNCETKFVRGMDYCPSCGFSLAF